MIRCIDDMEQHLDQSVLSKLPHGFKSHLKQSSLSLADDMGKLVILCTSDRVEICSSPFLCLLVYPFLCVFRFIHVVVELKRVSGIRD